LAAIPYGARREIPRNVPVALTPVETRRLYHDGMKLMLTVFLAVMLIVLDQTHYRGEYMDQLARVIAYFIN
jgi:hypothetical protein